MTYKRNTNICSHGAFKSWYSMKVHENSDRHAFYLKFSFSRETWPRLAATHSVWQQQQSNSYSAPKVTHQRKEVWWWNNSGNRKKKFLSTTHGFRGFYKYSPGCVRHGWGWVLDSRKTSGEVWMVVKRQVSFTNSCVASVKSGLCSCTCFFRIDYYWLPQLYMNSP